MRAAATLIAGLVLCGGVPAAEAPYAKLPGAPSFVSALKYEDQTTRGAPVGPFALMRRPVTNADFLAFVLQHPRWQRGRVPALFAEARYLSHWAGPTRLASPAQAQQPVTWVSWFAARAYCEARRGEAQGARLPTWAEWEYVAAADETRTDARADRRWRERILAWYARPSNHALPAVGLQPANVYGVHDLHGLVWEWTDDHSALLVAADNRNQGDADRAEFCGAGALAAQDRDHYAVLMRVAMLSSLQARDATANLGFRCAR